MRAPFPRMSAPVICAVSARRLVAGWWCEASGVAEYATKSLVHRMGFGRAAGGGERAHEILTRLFGYRNNLKRFFQQRNRRCVVTGFLHRRDGFADCAQEPAMQPVAQSE